MFQSEHNETCEEKTQFKVNKLKKNAINKIKHHKIFISIYPIIKTKILECNFKK